MEVRVDTLLRVLEAEWSGRHGFFDLPEAELVAELCRLYDFLITRKGQSVGRIRVATSAPSFATTSDRGGIHLKDEARRRNVVFRLAACVASRRTHGDDESRAADLACKSIETGRMTGEVHHDRDRIARVGRSRCATGNAPDASCEHCPS